MECEITICDGWGKNLRKERVVFTEKKPSKRDKQVRAYLNSLWSDEVHEVYVKDGDVVNRYKFDKNGESYYCWEE